MGRTTVPGGSLWRTLAGRGVAREVIVASFLVAAATSVRLALNPYLNFDGQCEDAMRFYARAFKAELGPISRYKDVPMEGMTLPDAEKDRVMHVSFPVGAGALMASDNLPSLGHKLTVGNHCHVSIHPDTRGEADRLFAALSEDGEIEMPMADAPWGDYFGSFKDRYGVSWMINHHPAP
jgi:PhnB protein